MAQLVDNAAWISKHLQTSYLNLRDASQIEPGFVPIIKTSVEMGRLLENASEELMDRSMIYSTNGLRYDRQSKSMTGETKTQINNHWSKKIELDDGWIFSRLGADLKLELQQRAKSTDRSVDEI